MCICNSEGFSISPVMNQVKVVLLGQEYGGKTSLVERFINQRFIDLPSDMYQAVSSILPAKSLSLNK